MCCQMEEDEVRLRKTKNGQEQNEFKTYISSRNQTDHADDEEN